MPFKFPYLLFIVLLLMGCEEVIDVNLDGAEQKVVVEAVITNLSGDARVAISSTNPVNDTATFNGLSGAEVRINGSNGRQYRFEERDKGIYLHERLAAIPGVTYTLTVNLEGKTYTATSTMPQWVRADSVFMTNDFLVNQTLKVANVAFKDDPSPGNAYLFEQYINKKKVDGFYIFNDDYTNGRPNIQKLFYFPGKYEDGISTGDSVLINFFNIEPQIYKYWFSVLRGSTGQSGQASPANPVSNMRGGALGYFSAQSRETFVIVAD